MVESPGLWYLRLPAGRCAALLAAGLLAASAVAAADGTVLAHGTAPFDLGGTLGDWAFGVAAQADGKFVTIGDVETGGSGTWALALARFLPGGGLDPTFGTGGKVVNPFGLGARSGGRAVAVLPTGGIVVAGFYDWGGGDTDFLVGRLLPDGTPDPLFSDDGWTLVAFDAGGPNADGSEALAVQGNGRVLVAGTASVSAGDREFAVARLTSNGALDPTFDGDGRAVFGIDLTTQGDDGATAVAIDTQGRIVLAGYTWSINGGGQGNYDIAIARLQVNGGLDPTFNGGLGRMGWAFDRGGSLRDAGTGVAVDSRDRIIVAGEVDTGDSTRAWVVLRSLESGAPDPAFAQGHSSVLGHFECGLEPGCVAVHDSATALRLQGDGRIVVGGWGWVDHTPDPDDEDFGVARLLPDGAADPSFGGGDGVTTFDFARGPGGRRDTGWGLTLAADGRIAVAGATEWSSQDTDFGFALFDSSYIFADGFEDWLWKWSAIVG